MEEQVWGTTLLSQTAAPFQAEKKLTQHPYVPVSGFLKDACECSFCNENNWFHCDSFPKPDPQRLSAVPDHSQRTKLVWGFLERTCAIGNLIFVIDMLLLRGTAKTLEGHPSYTRFQNSSAEPQKLAKSQDFFLFF